MIDTNIVKLPLAFALIGITLLSASCAIIPEPSKEELAKAKPYPLDVCLVIERPLNETPRTYTKIYKGQEVKFAVLIVSKPLRQTRTSSCTR